MKMIYVNFSVGVLPDIKKILNDNNIKDYQIIDRILSHNRLGDPRLDSPVWPGYNTALFIPLEDGQKAGPLFDSFRQFNQNAMNNDELISACSWNMDEYLYH